MGKLHQILTIAVAEVMNQTRAKGGDLKYTNKSFLRQVSSIVVICDVSMNMKMYDEMC